MISLEAAEAAARDAADARARAIAVDEDAKQQLAEARVAHEKREAERREEAERKKQEHVKLLPDLNGATERLSKEIAARGRAHNVSVPYRGADGREYILQSVRKRDRAIISDEMKAFLVEIGRPALLAINNGDGLRDVATAWGTTTSALLGGDRSFKQWYGFLQSCASETERPYDHAWQRFRNTLRGVLGRRMSPALVKETIQ